MRTQSPAPCPPAECYPGNVPAKDRYHPHIVDALVRDRVLYLAVRGQVYRDVFREPMGAMLVDNGRVRLMVFDPERREVEQWIP